MNARNQRTTHPRKAARRQRAANRFTVRRPMEFRKAGYLERKAIEAKALGIAMPD